MENEQQPLWRQFLSGCIPGAIALALGLIARLFDLGGWVEISRWNAVLGFLIAGFFVTSGLMLWWARLKQEEVQTGLPMAFLVFIGILLGLFGPTG